MKTRMLCATLGALALSAVGCGDDAPPAKSWEVGSGLRLDDGDVVSVVYGAGPGTVTEGNDSRLTDARAPLPGSTSYIQNGTEPQQASLSLTGSATTTAGHFVDAAAAVAAPVPLLRVTNTSTTPAWTALPLFSVDSAGGLVARGELEQGAFPASGKGLRLMWAPSKGAFRAGTATAAEWDDSNVGVYSWAGGANSRASAYGSFAFGDVCVASGVVATCFGSSNQATGSASFASGAATTASGFTSVAMGYTNNATGQGSVALGYRVDANADYSTAMGQRASSGGFKGSFIWADQSSTNVISNTAEHQFLVRASGGIQLRTNATASTGCNLPAGSGVFSCTSDRNQKEDFRTVDGELLLEKVARLPVESWRYKEEASGVRHVGPVAQDFRAAFGLGTDDTSIGMLDIDGVNMVAIQALERRTRQLRERDAEVDALKAELAELRRGLAELKAAMPRAR
ncbi:tail fiber domain-containing protein [Myxococcus faecalis]|uniref:tail fiber domain-containing protein n=1 Tax=Myxococcus faecalis TaxID=3115646 RepID=UPI003CE809A3